MKKILLLLTCLLCVSCNNNNRLSLRMSNVYWGIDEYMGYLLIYVGHNVKTEFVIDTTYTYSDYDVVVVKSANVHNELYVYTSGYARLVDYRL